MKILFFVLIIQITLFANIGNIMALKGSAHLERSTKNVEAKSGMVLLKGDVVITAKKSRVQVMLKDNTIITIGANSSFSFLEYKFDGTKNSRLSMRVNRGFFRSLTGKIGKLAPERFKVKTASATIGIRGTDFSATVMKDKEIFTCYQGKIFVKFQNNIRELSPGMRLELSLGKARIKRFFKKHKAARKRQQHRQTRSSRRVNKIADALKDARTYREPFKIISAVQDRVIKY